MTDGNSKYRLIDNDEIKTNISTNAAKYSGINVLTSTPISKETEEETSPSMIGFQLFRLKKIYADLIEKYKDSYKPELGTSLTNAFQNLTEAHRYHNEVLGLIPLPTLNFENEWQNREKRLIKMHKQSMQAKDKLFDLEKKLAIQAAKIDSKKELMECTICYQREKNTVIIPCSHTFCHSCINRLMETTKKCAVCRGDIEIVTRVRF